MKTQSGLKFSSELCFGIMNTTKDSYLLNSKVAFLNRGQNASGICPIFYGERFLQDVGFQAFKVLLLSEVDI